MVSSRINIFDDAIVFFYEYSSLKKVYFGHMLTHVEAAGGKFHYSVFAENRVSYLGSGRTVFPG